MLQTCFHWQAFDSIRGRSELSANPADLVSTFRRRTGRSIKAMVANGRVGDHTFILASGVEYWDGDEAEKFDYAFVHDVGDGDKAILVSRADSCIFLP